MSEPNHIATAAGGVGDPHPGRRRMIVGLRAVAVLSIISCVYGLAVAAPAGLLSPFERVAMPVSAAVSAVILIAVGRVSLDGLVLLSRAVAVFYCGYMAANLANALLVTGSLEAAAIYLGWTFPLYIFAYFLVGRAFARNITVPTSAAMAAVIVVYLAGQGREGVESLRGALLINAILAQFIAIALLLSVARFRELYAMERARAAAAGERLAASEHLAQQLQASEARYRSLVENSLDVICMLDRGGRFRDVGPRSREVWGHAPDALRGIALLDIVHADDREAASSFLQAAMQSDGPISSEIRIQAADGRAVPMLWLARWMASEQGIHAAARDVSERVEAEARIRQSQKLEAVGQLTGGVAHDFNNLLTVVIGNASMIERHAKEQVIGSLAAMIRAAAERGADLTRRLLTFARRQPLRPQSVELAALVQGGLPLVTRAVGEHIVVKVDPAPAELWTKVDPAELESAILNLAINARDAMPAGGTLTLSMGQMEIGPAEAADSDLEPGRYVTLDVTDTGSGMTPEVMRRAVEPFFTTKPPGKGTGLGLSAVYGFARQSGGGLQLRSDIGRGTTITIQLPVAAPAEPASTALLPEPMADPAGSRILVVEDDALVRNFVAKQLERLGFVVEAVGDARAALDRIEAAVPFDLLFTDIVMPGGMNGRELAEEARRRRPHLPILLTSGFTDDASAEGGPFPIIRKPYKPSELARVIREQLRAAA
ncbi:hybrid sensor histidine kinase/response regulator [Desertibaculum subflavum]|uniref:hybrid sensor histidine kinase/response regulator n=1 Tax=Desertibaculum subflavum TaxID=2268458 RepID=UPI000E660C6C